MPCLFHALSLMVIFIRFEKSKFSPCFLLNQYLYRWLSGSCYLLLALTLTIINCTFLRKYNRHIQSPTYLYHQRMESTYLIVASDDDDTDTSRTAILDGDFHFFTRGIQHTHNTNKCHVCLMNKDNQSLWWDCKNKLAIKTTLK